MIKSLPWAGRLWGRISLLCPLSIGTLGLFSCGRLQHGGRPCIHPSGSKSLASFHARDARPRGLSCACSGRTRVSRALLKGAMAAPRGAPLTRDVEAVEKVPKQILGRDAEKSDLTRMRHNQRSHAWEGSSDPRKHCSHLSKGLFLQARYVQDEAEP